ncbi:PQQ-binding-like beta-propeller repeat protein [Williamsia sp. 1138]|uniref:outer membrane protein assembly factor BamB family protein n=1 Tax=Williamsia sp. 1138 TaxID=1903117 RepID=UPI001FEE124E|nr:PQQ-binding-like beta-propeller repeat protein [Williamsia sp. 1138]
MTDGVGLVRIGNQMAQFDAESGTPLWTTGDGVCVSQASLEPGGVVAQINSDCESYDSVSGQLLRGPDGKVLTTTDSTTAHRPMLEHRDDASDPILLGDSAYDRSSGELLWTNPSIVSGSQGAVTAIVGDTIYLRDTNTQSETGIDLRTGKQLWHNDTTQTFDVAGAGGRTLLGNDGTALTEFDLRTGSVVWTAPFVSIDSDPETFATGRAAQRYRDGWIYSSDRRMIGLAPL